MTANKQLNIQLFHQISYRVFWRTALIALLLGSALLPAPVRAQSEATVPTTALQAEDREGALHLQWQQGVQSASMGVTTSYNGYLLPLQTLLVELPAGQEAQGALAAISVQGMSSSPYAGTLQPAPPVEPPALDYVPTPTNTPYVEAKLPESPIFIISEGTQRGRHLAVLGFSPIYQDPHSGEVLAVESFAASVAGATVATDATLSSNGTVDPNDRALFAPVSALASAPAPTNPFANANALKLLVSNAGIQQISGKDVADGGLSRIAGKLRVFYQGVEVPLHIIDGNSNDVLDDDDYLRFYAAGAGDAWNAKGVYWLVTGSTDGLRMNQRSVAAAGAPARNVAYEVGRHYQPSLHETTLAGADGDNWFQTDLSAESADAQWAITLPHQLPLDNALPMQLALHITPYAIGEYGSAVHHRLQISTSDYSTTDEWNADFTGTRPFQNMVRNVVLDKATDAWTITLLQESSSRAIKMDAIDYLLPVQLSFEGKGATIQGTEGTWRYQFSNTPTDITGGRALYDITDPAQPQLLPIPGGASFEMQDGPSAHRYVLTGAGTFFTPEIQPHSPANINASSAAHLVYIAPAEFHATLQPLVNLRQSQGYQVQVIDVQAIYDAWSYGMVNAEAIRAFLRYAVGNWSPAPIAAVLVGDGTIDPLNYTGNNNANLITPYIADVDPWIKYVPCESCFGQLDGDTPADDYLVDIWIGRFPVINSTELTAVIDKIVKYESDPDKQALWRSTSVQIADDDVRPDNSVDDAGPFVGSAEHVISLMPASVRQLRNYFMAATDFSNAPAELMQLLNAVQAWFIADPDAALRRSIDLMNSGAGLVTYTGHSNHWQWARISNDGEENKWLFGLIEVRSLFNRNTLFISMSMTCYTSQFTQPATLHYTLDERLFLHGNGGAVATWGPTGFSIVPAHDALQVGFHKLLWKSPPLQAKLGALTEAGYSEVFTSGQNYDVNKSFALFGDPLMSARVVPVDTVYMPRLGR